MLFCIFVFALVQRRWACFTWKGALEIQSLVVVVVHMERRSRITIITIIRVVITAFHILTPLLLCSILKVLFCIFVFALVQRRWACFTWKGALEMQSLVVVVHMERRSRNTIILDLDLDIHSTGASQWLWAWRNRESANFFVFIEGLHFHFSLLCLLESHYR